MSESKRENKIQIICSDNLEYLKTLPDNSIDSIVTDPPYGLGKEPDANLVLKDWLDKGYHEIKGKGFMGNTWDAFVPQPIFWKECLRVLKHGGHLLSFAGTRTYDWIVMGLRLSGFEIRDQIDWVYSSGFPKSLNIGKAIDKHFKVEREVIGIDEQWIKKVGGSSKSITYTCNGFGSNKGRNAGKITKPATDLAKQYAGWGTALKPAIEPIVMARKPLIGTVAQNVIKYRTGGINIDACRVGAEERFNKPATSKEGTFNNSFDSDYQGETVKGRFPANFIHDESKEVVSLFPDSKGAGGSIPNSKITGYGKNIGDGTYEYYGGNRKVFESGSGSAARFFYGAKTSQKERNIGLDELRNIHPTVKPINLMRYLVKLVTPKNGVVLDPFMGSGTTAIACELEDFDFIGIDSNEEYVNIAKLRHDYSKNHREELLKLLDKSKKKSKN